MLSLGIDPRKIQGKRDQIYSLETNPWDLGVIEDLLLTFGEPIHCTLWESGSNHACFNPHMDY